MKLYDAHNHLQDARFRPHLDQVLRETLQAGVTGMVVNGTRPEDWPQVRELAAHHSFILPSYGVHPWHVKDLSPDWFESWRSYLDAGPCAVGEIGLDRWVRDFDLPRQEEIFLRQWQVAAERNLPVSIHCLKTWGRLLEILQAESRPAPGFLLHSYGGPGEMVESFRALGAYFSISGHFAHDRKSRQREVFRAIPLDRLLVETDAPDMTPPERWRRLAVGGSRRTEDGGPRTGDGGGGRRTEDGGPRTEDGGGEGNHPGNLRGIYEFAAELRGLPLETLAAQVADNFQRLFGRSRE